ncbi:hypothetical protein BCR36DRAFT_408217 [Piromyces finnis]|uniref:PHD-type domain-containing protein n=1 Tax=Piromyces finnis TaxID=1754191 RepID=A0A1Y1VN88_9FUNG|nr:hypothetical protein BCR36DRAFT_408217 [Piromyces finnis]|eukprot:ORX59840.1 hypothetical protein BCR36DRAFT_408217 [Piromyces finnis]
MDDVDPQLITNPTKKRKYNQKDIVVCESCNKSIPLKSSIKLYNTTLCFQCKVIFTGGRQIKSVVDYSEKRSRSSSRSVNIKSESIPTPETSPKYSVSSNEIRNNPLNKKQEFHNNVENSPTSTNTFTPIAFTEFSTSNIPVALSKNPVNTNIILNEAKKVKRCVGRPKKNISPNINTQKTVIDLQSTSVVSSNDSPKIRKKRGPKKKKKKEAESNSTINNTIDLDMSLTIDLLNRNSNTSSIQTSNDIIKKTQNTKTSHNNMNIDNIININTNTNTNSNSDYNNTNSDTNINNTIINTNINNSFKYNNLNSPSYTQFSKDTASYPSPDIRHNLNSNSLIPNSLNYILPNPQCKINSSSVKSTANFPNYNSCLSSIKSQSQNPNTNINEINKNEDFNQSKINDYIYSNQSKCSYLSPEEKTNNFNYTSRIETKYNNQHQPSNLSRKRNDFQISSSISPISSKTSLISSSTTSIISNRSVVDINNNDFNSVNSEEYINNYSFNNDSNNDTINQNLYQVRSINHRSILPSIGTFKQHIPIHKNSTYNSQLFLLNNGTSSHYVSPSLQNNFTHKIPETPKSYIDDNQHSGIHVSYSNSSNSNIHNNLEEKQHQKEEMKNIHNEDLSFSDNRKDVVEDIKNYHECMPNNISFVNYSSNNQSIISSSSQTSSKCDNQGLYTSHFSSSISSSSLGNKMFLNSSNSDNYTKNNNIKSMDSVDVNGKYKYFPNESNDVCYYKRNSSEESAATLLSLKQTNNNQYNNLYWNDKISLINENENKQLIEMNLQKLNNSKLGIIDNSFIESSVYNSNVLHNESYAVDSNEENTNDKNKTHSFKKNNDESNELLMYKRESSSLMPYESTTKIYCEEISTSNNSNSNSNDNIQNNDSNIPIDSNSDKKCLKKGIVIEVLDSNNNWRKGYIMDLTSNEFQVKYHLSDSDSQQWIPLNSRCYRIIHSNHSNIKEEDINIISVKNNLYSNTSHVKRGRGRPKGSKGKPKVNKIEEKINLNSQIAEYNEKDISNDLENNCPQHVNTLDNTTKRKRGRKKKSENQAEIEPIKYEKTPSNDVKKEEEKKKNGRGRPKGPKKQTNIEKIKEDYSENNLKKRGRKSILEKYKDYKVLEEDLSTFNKLMYGKDFNPIQFEVGKKAFKYDDQYNVYYAVEMLREDIVVDPKTQEEMKGVLIHYIEWDDSWDEWISKENKDLVECDPVLYERIEFIKDGITAYNFKSMVIDYMIEKYDSAKQDEIIKANGIPLQTLNAFNTLGKSLTLHEQQDILTAIDNYTEEHYLIKSSETYEIGNNTDDLVKDSINKRITEFNRRHKTNILFHQFYSNRVEGINFPSVDKINRFRDEIEHISIDRNIRFRYGMFESENAFDILDYDPSILEGNHKMTKDLTSSSEISNKLIEVKKEETEKIVIKKDSDNEFLINNDIKNEIAQDSFTPESSINMKILSNEYNIKEGDESDTSIIDMEIDSSTSDMEIGSNINFIIKSKPSLSILEDYNSNPSGTDTESDMDMDSGSESDININYQIGRMISNNSQYRKQLFSQNNSYEDNSESEMDMEIDSEGSEVYEYYLKNIKPTIEKEKEKSIEHSENSECIKMIKKEGLLEDEDDTIKEDSSEEMILKSERNDALKNIVKEEDEVSEDATIKDEEVVTKGEHLKNPKTFSNEESESNEKGKNVVNDNEIINNIVDNDEIIKNENINKKEGNNKNNEYNNDYLKKEEKIETLTSFMEDLGKYKVTKDKSPEEYYTRLAVKRKEDEIKIGTNLTMCKKKSHISNHKLALEEWIPCNTIYTNNDQLYIKQVYCDAQGRLKLSRDWCSRDSHIVREEFYDNFSYIAVNFINEKRVICGHLFPNQDVKLWEPRRDDYMITGPIRETKLEEDEDLSTITGPIIYCKGCMRRIKDVRYYCTYCEKSEDDIKISDKEQETSYNLCLYCIQCNFPSHIHPRLSFAYQNLNAKINDLQLLEQKHHMEELDKDYYHRIEISANDTTSTVQKQKVYPKKCAFCDEGEYTSGETFISHYPFKPGDSKLNHLFWAHENCAIYSPGVYKTVEGHWFNLSDALVRARKTKCAECKHRGATIKCFDPGCHKVYHLSCTHKQNTYFEEGMIFWCPYHERLNEELDSWEEKYNCDVCGIELNEESWYTCKKCSNDNYFSTFDLCVECYEHSFPKDHDHPKEQFKMIYSKDKKKDLQEKQEEEIEYYEKKSKYYQQFELKRKRKLDGEKTLNRCIYCNAEITSDTPWRSGYNGLVMCEKCFTKAPTQFINDNENKNGETVNVVEYNTSSNVGKYAAAVEDYAYQYYLTRDLYAKIQTEGAEIKYLKTYSPTDDQLYSLFFDYSYYDIVSRAPRWATHSGTDYHGTWLPQIVRMALMRYSYRNDKVLSNFLGRGTDVIECFLLQRKSCGIDINPTSIQLSQRNLAFAIPETFSEEDRPNAEHRPILIQGDSRQLKGPLFVNNSYDLILSHPPYKDCVAYSSHIEGDLSRFPDLDDFYLEMKKVVKETWRLLKPNCRCILGIGDNRRGRYYQPVSYQAIRNYLDEGFIIEELILKRQRYCQASPLGLFLCTQHDFLMFTHEFIIILRKVPHPKEKPFSLKPLEKEINIPYNKSIRLIPSYPSERKSVVIGTVWNLAISRSYGLQELTLSRALERFGRDNEYWEEIDLFDYQEKLQDFCFTHPSCVNDIEENEDYFDDEDRIMRGGADELTESSDYTNAISNYELERQRRIQKNNECLVNLGLLMELNKNNSSSNNYIYFQKIFNTPPEKNFNIEERKLFIIFIPHLDIPSTYIFKRSKMEWITEYRHFIIEQAKAAVNKLKNGGLFIVGGKDIRVGELVSRDGDVYEGSLEDDFEDEFEEGSDSDDDEVVDMDISDDENENDLEDGEIMEERPESEVEEGEADDVPIKSQNNKVKKKVKKYLRSEYIPLSILLYEDIYRNVSSEELKLREFFIVTPEGYECDNKNVDISKMKTKLKETYAEYDKEKIIENKYFDGQFSNHANIRRIAPIVNAFYLVFIKLPEK